MHVFQFYFEEKKWLQKREKIHVAGLLIPDKAFSVINYKSIIKTITNFYELFWKVMTHIDEHIKHLFVSKATNVNK